MDSKRIDIVHRFDSPTPSLKNLLQGLQCIDESWDIHVHSLRPNIPGSNKFITAVELGVFSLKVYEKVIKINTVYDSDVLIIHKSLYGDLIDRVFDTVIAERLFLTNNNVIYSTYDADYVEFPKKTAYLFKNTSHILATSKAIKQEAQKYASNDNISYVAPSVDTDFFNPHYSVPEDLETDSLVIGWIGNADVHQDNIWYLAECLNELEDDDIILRLLLGGGSISSELRNELSNLDIGLHTIDSVPWEDVPVVINSFDVGLAPLEDTEFNRGRSSEKVREYMACGIPVIASDVGENPHLLGENTGILVSSRNDWVNAVAEFRDDTKRLQMGHSARQHISENYAIDVIAEQLSHCIKRVV